MPSGLDVFSPSVQDRWDVTKAGHLLRRAGFGALPSEVASALESGPERAVDALFDAPSGLETPPPFDAIRPAEARADAVFRDVLRAKITPKDSPEVRAAYEEVNRAHARGIVALTSWWLERMARTQAPLREKLTLFWHGHFTSSFGDVHDAVAMYNQNQLFRQHAAGNFARLLDGVARDPAMLRYLNNDANRKGHPNENWARELMELFTMGIGHYSETDIRESARAWTGWTLRGYRTFEDRRTFAFRGQLHDDGMKTFLGQSGAFDGADILRIILANPATPRFIAGKLAKFFVSPTPDPALVEGMAQHLIASGYELAPVLRALFRSRAFYHPAVIHAQIKSPVEFVVGAVRHLGISAPDWGRLSPLTAEAGQHLFFPSTVKGWDGGKAWINAATVFARANLAGDLLAGRLGTPNTTGLSSVETMSAYLLQHPLSPGRRAILADIARGNRDAAIHLIMSLPDYQVA
ncbi:MAG TPA: DUF1800 domain-containing protein [bacterium]|nr:DUF1800 domain-containing protein [bacterium]